MDLLSLALSLSLPMSKGEFTGDYSFNIDPTVGMRSSLMRDRNAMTLPGVVVHNEDDFAQSGEFLRHELAHREQQSALGPAFFPAYALTGGRAFEPYDPIGQILPSAWDGYSHDMDRTWMPPDEMKGKFPLFRVSREGDESKVQFLPGYPELINERIRQ